ncbi:hypothetical protein, partial [Roseimaritima sediminicola]|uniref:hypothetical protein n=1 Tax=Roseimaritima sediminicola TaxID=2662066 RepID=UPI001F3C93A3
CLRGFGFCLICRDNETAWWIAGCSDASWGWRSLFCCIWQWMVLQQWLLYGGRIEPVRGTNARQLRGSIMLFTGDLHLYRMSVPGKSNQ